MCPNRHAWYIKRCQTHASNWTFSQPKLSMIKTDMYWSSVNVYSAYIVYDYTVYVCWIETISWYGSCVDRCYIYTNLRLTSTYYMVHNGIQCRVLWMSPDDVQACGLLLVLCVQYVCTRYICLGFSLYRSLSFDIRFTCTLLVAGTLWAAKYIHQLTAWMNLRLSIEQYCVT